MPNAPRETPPTCGTCRFAKGFGDWTIKTIGQCTWGRHNLPLVDPRASDEPWIFQDDFQHCPVHQPRKEPADA